MAGHDLMEVSDTLEATVRARIQARGLTLEQAADAAGVSRLVVRMLLEGERLMRIEDVGRLANWAYGSSRHGAAARTEAS